MEDILYLSKLPIRTSEIVEYAVKAGYKGSDHHDGTARVVPERNTYWEFARPEEADMRCLEDDFRQRLEALKPGSMFFISHHFVLREKLVRFLRSIMVDKGGWIVGDSDVLELYDVTHLGVYVEKHCKPVDDTRTIAHPAMTKMLSLLGLTYACVVVMILFQGRMGHLRFPILAAMAITSFFALKELYKYSTSTEQASGWGRKAAKFYLYLIVWGGALGLVIQITRRVIEMLR